jgi:hypothetical protein
MAEVDRALCRHAAVECIALARMTSDPDTKQTLLTRGQEWLKLAYSEHDDEFERLLGEFNTQQMGVEQARAPVQRVLMQQPVQQQQSKTQGPGEEG